MQEDEVMRRKSPENKGSQRTVNQSARIPKQQVKGSNPFAGSLASLEIKRLRSTRLEAACLLFGSFDPNSDTGGEVTMTFHELVFFAAIADRISSLTTILKATGGAHQTSFRTCGWMRCQVLRTFTTCHELRLHHCGRLPVCVTRCLL